jgi:hypothetical protein
MDILEEALRTAGGLTVWREHARLKAHFMFSDTSALARHHESSTELIVEMDFKNRELRITDFPDVDLISIYRPGCLVVETAEQEGVGTWTPLSSQMYAAANRTEEKDFRKAYLCGTTLFNSFAMPFLAAEDCATIRELAPLDVHGEEMRRLAVCLPLYPDFIAAEQIFYFSAVGHLRQIDWIMEADGATASHHLWAHQSYDGLLLPTLHRVELYPNKTETVEAGGTSWLNFEIFDVSFF